MSFVKRHFRQFCLWFDFFYPIPAFLLFICFEMKDAHEKFKDLHMLMKKNEVTMTSGSSEEVPVFSVWHIYFISRRELSESDWPWPSQCIRYVWHKEGHKYFKKFTLQVCTREPMDRYVYANRFVSFYFRLQKIWGWRWRMRANYTDLVVLWRVLFCTAYLKMCQRTMHNRKRRKVSFLWKLMSSNTFII